MKCPKCGNPRFKKLEVHELGFGAKIRIGKCPKCGKVIYADELEYAFSDKMPKLLAVTIIPEVAKTY